MKELLAQFKTRSGDYLVLVKWHNKGYRFNESTDDWERADEYVVACTWNPARIQEDGWGQGHYFTNLDSAKAYYSKRMINE